MVMPTQMGHGPGPVAYGPAGGMQMGMPTHAGPVPGMFPGVPMAGPVGAPPMGPAGMGAPPMMPPPMNGGR
jgi:hypothetical protein